MKIGIILAIVVFACCIIGCKEKPSQIKTGGRNFHSLEIEVTRKVKINEEVEATATWNGGTPPYELYWHFTGTLGNRGIRPATSPDVESFILTRNDGEIGREYSAWVYLSDAEGNRSSAYARFIIVRNPLEPNAGGLFAFPNQQAKIAVE